MSSRGISRLQVNWSFAFCLRNNSNKDFSYKTVQRVPNFKQTTNKQTGSDGPKVPTYPVVWDTFQFIQFEKVDRILGCLNLTLK